MDGRLWMDFMGFMNFFEKKAVISRAVRLTALHFTYDKSL